jgi:hypothetical protein
MECGRDALLALAQGDDGRLVMFPNSDSLGAATLHLTFFLNFFDDVKQRVFFK